MSDRTTDAIAADNLQAACTAEIEYGLSTQQGLADLIATSFLQANFAQHALAAIIAILKQQNIVSDAILTRALTNAYNEAAAAKRNASSRKLIVPPAPKVRTN